MKLNNQQLDAIRRLCPHFYVTHLYAFGSVIGESFNEQSDVDLLVSFAGVPMLDFADNYFDFHEALEKIVVRKVDLVIEKSLTNPVLIRSINKSKQPIYATA
jgi:uncharacterized protein